MAYVRTMSGVFATVMGNPIEVLDCLYKEKVKDDSRIVGFCISGAFVLVLYRC